jgi:hypothetical protein
MIISEAFRRQLKDMLAENPLKDKEMRRVEGLGALYISLVSEDKAVSGYEFLYSYTIDDQVYKFYTELVPLGSSD